MINQILTGARYALLAFRRNPAATFFTVIFPIVFLLLFGLIFGDEIHDSGAKISTFQVPGILGMSIVSATFVNLAMGSVFKREAGQLKRLRGTPLRPLVWVAGQILASLILVVVMTILVTVIGRLLFGVAFNIETIGVFVVTVLLGAIVFSALGLAVTAIIPNQDAAPAVTNAIVLPLYFISDIFLISDDDGGGWLSSIGNFFPVKRLVRALQPSYNPFVETVEIPWAEWAVLAVWGVVGVAAASLFFRWTPQADRR